MNISIVFDNTGDVISFTPLRQNYDIAEYYVENLNTINENKFSLKYSFDYLSNRIASLDTCLRDVNKFIFDLTEYTFPEYSESEYLNQNKLNRLHADWAQLQLQSYDIKAKQFSSNSDVVTMANRVLEYFSDDVLTPAVGTVLTSLGLFDKYGDINLAIHDLESALQRFTFVTTTPVTFDNPFPKNRLTNDLSNFTISFNHLGRTLYNKFETFDNKLEFNDENSYDELLGFVSIQLVKSQTIPLSTEYIKWCNSNNKIPSGNYLNLGNLPDIDTKLNDYRLVLYRNIKDNNKISIHLN